MENKTGKYFKFAIGEVVLVVIGILIALSINNWNTDRLEKKEVANFLEQIETELESDIIQFNLTFSNIQRYTDYLNKDTLEKFVKILPENKFSKPLLYATGEMALLNYIYLTLNEKVFQLFFVNTY